MKEENKKEYVNMLAKYLMVDRINKQVQAFIEGKNNQNQHSYSLFNNSGMYKNIWNQSNIEINLESFLDRENTSLTKYEKL